MNTPKFEIQRLDRDVLIFPELSGSELESLPSGTRIIRFYPLKAEGRYRYNYMYQSLNLQGVKEDVNSGDYTVTLLKADRTGLEILLNSAEVVSLDSSWLDGRWITTEKFGNYLESSPQEKRALIASLQTEEWHSLGQQIAKKALTALKHFYPTVTEASLSEITNRISNEIRNRRKELIQEVSTYMVIDVEATIRRVLQNDQRDLDRERPYMMGLRFKLEETLKRSELVFDLMEEWGEDGPIVRQELTITAQPICRGRCLTERDLNRRVVQVNMDLELVNRVGEKLLAIEGGYMRLSGRKELVPCDDSWLTVAELLELLKREPIDNGKSLRIIVGITSEQREKLAGAVAKCILNAAKFESEGYWKALRAQILEDLNRSFANPLHFYYGGFLIDGAETLRRVDPHLQLGLPDDYLIHLRWGGSEEESKLVIKLVEWKGSSARVKGTFVFMAFDRLQQPSLTEEELERLCGYTISVTEAQWRGLAYEVAKRLFAHQQQGIQLASEVDRSNLVLQTTGLIFKRLQEEVTSLPEGIVFRAGLLLQLVPPAILQRNRIDFGYHLELKIDRLATNARSELLFSMVEYPGDRSQQIAQRTVALSELTTELPAVVQLISVSGFKNSCGLFALVVGAKRALAQNSSDHLIPENILNMEESLLVQCNQNPTLLDQCDAQLRAELVQAIRENVGYKEAQRGSFLTAATAVFSGNELFKEMDSFRGALKQFCETLKSDLEEMYGAPPTFEMLELFGVTVAELVASALDEPRWEEIFDSHCAAIQAGELMIPGDVLGVLAKRWHINLSVQTEVLHAPYFSTEKQEGWPLVQLCNPSEEHWLVIVPNS